MKISRATIAYALLFFLELASGFLLKPTQRQVRGTKQLLKQSSSSSDDDFMASLKSRVQQVSDRETKLPLVVLDSMLPRQVLKITVNNPVFMELVRRRVVDETPFFGMLGLARLATTGAQVHLKSGVQVDIVGKPVVNANGLQIELKAVRRFRITGEVDNAPAGWTEARVEFLSDKDDESEINEQKDRLGLARAMSKARQLTSLVTEWTALARTKERQQGQIDRLLLDLGDMPSSEEPTDRAFWVGALVNPIPAMGVALEIRPGLLSATTAEERVDIALAGIQRSIRHMQGEPLLS
jgi:Lon protease-like protein